MNSYDYLYNLLFDNTHNLATERLYSPVAVLITAVITMLFWQNWLYMAENSFKPLLDK